MKMSKYENNDSISKEYLQHIPDELAQGFTTQAQLIIWAV